MEYSCRLQPGSEASVNTPKRRVVILVEVSAASILLWRWKGLFADTRSLK